MHSFFYTFFTTCWNSARVPHKNVLNDRLFVLHFFFCWLLVVCRPSAKMCWPKQLRYRFHAGLYVPAFFFHCDKMLTVIWLFFLFVLFDARVTHPTRHTVEIFCQSMSLVFFFFLSRYSGISTIYLFCSSFSFALLFLRLIITIIFAIDFRWCVFWVM